MLELLSPAGDLEKCRTAILFGADAVYAGLENMSLRASGMSLDTLKTAIDLCHAAHKKFYLAINSFLFNENIDALSQLLPKIIDLAPDAFIVSDPGLIDLLQKKTSIALHLSTQANTTNWASVNYWACQGIQRIIPARELSLLQIRQIHEQVPQIELEVFVHGAMCMAFSGRCLLSDYLTARSANQGQCTQPCRWEYQVKEIHPPQGKRPAEFFIEETQGTTLINSKDLCMIEYLPDIISSGIRSIKIEGRMKPAYYTALTTKCYRQAIDAITQYGSSDLPPLHSILFALKEQLFNVSHRPYSTGFYRGHPLDVLQSVETSRPIKPYVFVGTVSLSESQGRQISVRNHIQDGDVLEFLDPAPSVLSPWQTWQAELSHPVHNGGTITLPDFLTVSVGSMVRKKGCTGFAP